MSTRSFLPYVVVRVLVTLGKPISR
jgi:hypothetical protein